MTLLRNKVGILRLATFEPSEMLYWTHNASAGRTAVPDTVLFTEGTQAFRITMPAGGQVIAKKHMPFDNSVIAAGDTFSIKIYISAAVTGWIRISFTNLLSGTGNILRRDISLGSLVAGQWNTVTWTKSQMTAFGTWAADPRALGLMIDFNHTPAESIFAVFDDFRVAISEFRL